MHIPLLTSTCGCSFRACLMRESRFLRRDPSRWWQWLVNVDEVLERSPLLPCLHRPTARSDQSRPHLQLLSDMPQRLPGLVTLANPQEWIGQCHLSGKELKECHDWHTANNQRIKNNCRNNSRVWSMCDHIPCTLHSCRCQDETLISKMSRHTDWIQS